MDRRRAPADNMPRCPAMDECTDSLCVEHGLGGSIKAPAARRAKKTRTAQPETQPTTAPGPVPTPQQTRDNSPLTAVNSPTFRSITVEEQREWAFRWAYGEEFCAQRQRQQQQEERQRQQACAQQQASAQQKEDCIQQLAYVQQGKIEEHIPPRPPGWCGRAPLPPSFNEAARADQVSMLEGVTAQAYKAQLERVDEAVRSIISKAGCQQDIEVALNTLIQPENISRFGVLPVPLEMLERRVRRIWRLEAARAAEVGRTVADAWTPLVPGNPEYMEQLWQWLDSNAAS